MIQRAITLLAVLAMMLLAAAPTGTKPKQRRAPSKRAPKSPAARTWPAWVGEWPRLTGRQDPKYESSFPGDGSDGDKAAQFGHRIARLRCLPWEWLTLQKIMRRRPDGLWTHPDVCLVCTRQQGKTLILILRILFGLFWLGETIVYSAQRGQTSDAVYDRVKTIIEKRPSLMKRVVSMTGGKQGRADIVVRSRNGKVAHARFGVRSGDLGRGLDQIDLVVFDESYNLTEVEVASLTGAQIASPNSQTIYTSTAPVASQHPFCHVFAGIRRRGLRGEPDLLFLEFAAPDPPADEVERKKAREDRDNWRLASPSYGVISKERDIERFRKNATTGSAIAIWEADYLGWGEWPAAEEDHEPVIPIEEVWRPLTDHEPELAGQRVLAVSRTQDGARWTVGVGQRTITGAVQLEVGKHWKATIGQAAAYVMILVEKWDPVAIVVEGHDPAAPLAPYLRKLGVDVLLTSGHQFAIACAGFIDAAFSGDISHSDQPMIVEELESATMRELPKGDRVWDTRESSVTGLMVLTLAHWATLEFAEEDAPASLPVSASANSAATSSGEIPVELTF